MVTGRMPAMQHYRYAQSAADSLVGKKIDLSLLDGYQHGTEAVVRAAEVIESGRAIFVTAEPLMHYEGGHGILCSGECRR